MTVALLLISIVVLLLLRVPVAFSFLGPGLAYLVLTDQSVGLAMRLITNSTASFPLLAVPVLPPPSPRPAPGPTRGGGGRRQGRG